MNVLHFLATGGTGGIESLIREYADQSKLNNYYVVFWGSGVNSELMKKNGHNVIDLNLGKKDVIKTYRCLKEFVKDLKIDAIVTHHAAPAMWFYMTMLKIKFPKLLTYIYAHGALKDMLRVEKKQWRLCKMVLNFAFKRCTKVIAISQSVRNSFSAFGFKLDKIKVIYNGVDCSKFIPNVSKKNETLHLVYVGRLIKQKGVDRLISAVSMLNTKTPFVCDIIGDGLERSNLENLARDLKVEDKVFFHGTRNDVPDFLSNENVFVHPAAWEEGFGIALVEGMAAGLVPIAYKKGAIPEIIDDGVNGFIVEEETPESLAKSIEKVISDYNTDYMIKIRNAAIDKAKKFDMTIFVKKLDDAICSGDK